MMGWGGGRGEDEGRRGDGRGWRGRGGVGRWDGRGWKRRRRGNCEEDG